MKFTEMCEELLNGDHKMAVQKSYPILTTTVRVCDYGRSGKILTYYDMEDPKTPFVITKELFDANDWHTFDSMDEWMNIPNFMKMPNAKEFITELYDSVNSKDWNGRFTRAFTDKEGYQFRFQEAIELRIILANRKKGTLVFTDIGEDLIKTL